MAYLELCIQTIKKIRNFQGITPANRFKIRRIDSFGNGIIDLIALLAKLPPKDIVNLAKIFPPVFDRNY